LHAGLNVPYYRDLFRSIRFDPPKIKSLKDIEHIPLLDKESVRKNPEQFMVDNKNIVRGYWKCTSGSTGKPLRIFIDRNCHVNKYAATLRAYHWAGYSPGKRALMLVEPQDSNKRLTYRLLSNSLLYTPTYINPESVVKFHRLLRRFRPKYFIGYGRGYLYLYKTLSECQLEIPRAKSLVNYGESICETDKRKLERFFSTTFYDFYGNWECSVMAADVKPGKQYLMEDFFYPEVIDDRDQVIEEGTGELIGTGFYNYAMPLIRYRSNDILTVKNYSEEHDHKFTQVQQIQGRVNDKIFTPSGREFFYLGPPLFEIKGIISSQFIQERTDGLTVKLLVDETFSFKSIGQIKRNLLEFIGEQMNIDIQLVDKLEERGSGKRPVIISRLS
jgi:phenylacetate-CoA ligase